MKKQAILSTLITLSLSATCFASGVNNTIQGQFGADAVGNTNTITAAASGAFAAGYNNHVNAAYAVAIGANNHANGQQSFVGGNNSETVGANSIAFGDNAHTNFKDTYAIGRHAVTSGENAIAFGNNASADKQMATAIGYAAKAQNEYSIAVGYMDVAKGNQATAIGFQNKADGQNASALGSDNTTSAGYSTAVGFRNTASEVNATSVGAYNTASGNASFAAGVLSTASKKDTVAIGHTANATGEYTIAIGSNATAGDYDSIAIGKNANTAKAGTIVIGRNATSNAELSLAVGTDTESNWGGTAIGTLAKATGVQSTALGNGTNATSVYATAVGIGSKATGNASTAVGSVAKADGSHSVAMGYVANASGKKSIAIGDVTAASGLNSVAIGTNNKAEGEAAVNIGSNNTGVSTRATVVGNNNNINYTDHMVDPDGDVVVGANNSVQDGYYGVAIGKDNSISNADYAVAIGNSTSVSVAESVAIGHEAKADTVVGTTSANIAGKQYNFAGGTPVGTVSIGYVNKERTITNVAAGRISATSTDAINGSQLNSVINSINSTDVIGDAERNILVRPTTKANGDKEFKVELNSTLSGMSAVNLGDHADGTVIEHGLLHIANSDNNSVSYLYSGVGSFNKENKSIVDINQNTNGVLDAINVRNMVDPNTQLAINSDGIVIKGDTDYETKMSFSTVSGIHAGNQQIHDVAAGTAPTDAVNVSQLKEVEDKITNISGNVLGESKSYTDSEAAKVGAASAALAALHPLEFNKDDKWQFAVGFGNYKNKTATAIGAFYQPNENVLLSLGTTLGAKNNMVNGGATFRFGKNSKMNTDKQIATDTKVQSLEQRLAEIEAKYNELLAKVESK